MVSIENQTEIEILENTIQELIDTLEISEKEKNLEISNIQKQYKEYEEEDQKTIENLYRENGRLQEKIKTFKEHKDLIKTNLKEKVKNLESELDEWETYRDRMEKIIDIRNKKIQEQKETIENLSKTVQELEKQRTNNFLSKKFQEQDKLIENINKKLQEQEKTIEIFNKKIQEFEKEENNININENDEYLGVSILKTSELSINLTRKEMGCMINLYNKQEFYTRLWGCFNDEEYVNNLINLRIGGHIREDMNKNFLTCKTYDKICEIMFIMNIVCKKYNKKMRILFGDKHSSELIRLYRKKYNEELYSYSF